MTEPDRGQWRPGLDEDLDDLVDLAVKAAVQDGATEQEAVADVERRFNDALPGSLDETADALERALRRLTPGMIASETRTRRRFERRIDWLWGDALNDVHVVVVSCTELGGRWADRERSTKDEAMVAVHARACGVALDIEALIRTGHPSGAWGRWRTLHELHVVLTLLGAGDDDLARRYLLHGAAQEHREALAHDAVRDRSGDPPWATPQRMADLKTNAKLAAAEFGPRFHKDWGWAAHLVGKEFVTFRRLEELAELDHRRPAYVEASHHTHADSTGTYHMRHPFRDGLSLASGTSNYGLDAPAHALLTTFTDMTLTLMTESSTTLLDIATLRLLSRLSDEAVESLRAPQLAVVELEARYGRAEGSRVRMGVFRVWRIGSMGRTLLRRNIRRAAALVSLPRRLPRRLPR